MTQARISRQQLIDTLGDGLSAIDYVRAAWLGGSEASGRTDEWSDIDLVLIVDDGRWEEAFDAIHRIVKTLGPVVHSWRLPEPTWHGHHQEFLRVDGAEPFHDLDVVIMEASTPGRLLERERHGDAVVLFDRDGLVKPEPLDRAAHAAKMRDRLALLREQFPMMQVLVRRAVLRRMPAEAAALYQRLTVAPLVEVLRMRHAPERYDFGVRYIDRDLPPDLRQTVESLALPHDLAHLEALQRQAAALFDETLAQFDAGHWQLPAG